AVAAETELEVIGVIRHKILFKDRPKALISKPQVKEKKTLPLPAPAAAPPPQSS
ncbi:Os09g0299300, partial [Oryza sativa Japonica Group]